MFLDRRLIFGKLELQLTDALVIAALLFFSLVALVFFLRVEGWSMLVLKNAGVALFFLGAVYVTPRIHHRFLRFLVRVAAITLSYAYLFGAVDKLQLIFHDEWLDPYILDLEQYLFGFQPTLWTETFTSPWLTEWMMFSYVIYVPLYPILCGIIYFTRGELPMEEYFFTLGLTNILCDIGFILFPVASPMYYIKEIYTVPLDGYVFTFLGELMRSQLHYAGGSIPSPHAAAATIMWVMAFRYHRPSFYVLTPIVLSLYVSTFYGRYHYLTDAIVGIITAAIALALAPVLMRAWDRLVEKGTIRLMFSRTEAE
ncbi:MAG: phosphatase PAP2 family protein [Ignavibacteriales bacterium]|nr:phosphatase PAP2 family protein [Ignavibacteriales bacterium]